MIITELKDMNGQTIVVPIEINGNGVYNNVYINENQIKSAYGRKKLQDYLNKNNFEEIYKKREELDFNPKVQYSNIASSSLSKKIPYLEKNVNGDTSSTKYSMQEDENNALKTRKILYQNKIKETS